MLNTKKTICTYYKHDNGFGYNIFSIDENLDINDEKNYSDSLRDGFCIDSLELLAQTLKWRSMKGKNQITELINLVTKESNRFVNNPVVLDEDQNNELIRMLNS